MLEKGCQGIGRAGYSSPFLTKPRSCFCTRLMQKVKRVALVAFVFLSVCLSPLVARVNWPFEKQCYPDPPLEASLQLHPGFFHYNSSGISISADVAKNLEHHLVQLKNIKRSTPQEAIFAAVNRFSHVELANGKGIRFEDPYIPPGVEYYIGLNPTVFYNHLTALYYIHHAVAVKGVIFKGDVGALKTFIERANGYLLQGISPDAGKIRTIHVLVSSFHDGGGLTLEDKLQILRQRGASEEELDLFKKSSLNKTSIASLYLNPKERKVWEKLYYFPPLPQDLPRALQKLAKKLRKWDPQRHFRDLDRMIRNAAKVHLQLVKDHYTSGGNGRLARAVLRAMLMPWYQWIIFRNERSYYQAVAEGIRDSRLFEDYVRDEIYFSPFYQRALAQFIKTVTK